MKTAQVVFVLAAVCVRVTHAQVAASAGIEPASAAKPALVDVRLDALTAFAKLVGTIRYFHPSDSALATNWDAFTITGVRRLGNVTSREMLRDTLRAIVAGVAPTVRVERAEAPPAPNASPAGNAARVRWWRHAGVRHARTRNASPLYTSTIQVGSRDSATAAWASPGMPTRIELGSGLVADVPTAVAASDLSGDTTRTPRARPLVDGFPIRNESVRIASVIDAWNVFEHFYPYLELARVDWEGALTRALRSAMVDSTGARHGETMSRMVAEAKDGHGNVDMPSQAFPMPIGVTFAAVEGRVIVAAVADSVTEIARGDVVLAIDGRPAVEVLRERQAMVSGATARHVERRALRELSHSTSPVILSVERDGRSRDVVVSPSRGRFVMPGGPVVTDVAPGIAYVNAALIHPDSVDAAVQRLQGAKGVVVDLREPPLSNAPLALLAHFVGDTAMGQLLEVPIATRPVRSMYTFATAQWKVAPASPRLTSNVAFLIDGGGISFIESLAGVVEGNRLGALVGEATGGTNGDLNEFIATGNVAVTFTGRRVRKADGSPLYGVGVQPTVPVNPTIDGMRQGIDESLRTAVALLQRGRP